MKELDENLIRIKAREACKFITDQGSPYGPNEAFYYGFKFSQEHYLKEIRQLENEVYHLKRELNGNK